MSHSFSQVKPLRCGPDVPPVFDKHDSSDYLEPLTARRDVGMRVVLNDYRLRWHMDVFYAAGEANFCTGTAQRHHRMYVCAIFQRKLRNAVTGEVSRPSARVNDAGAIHTSATRPEEQTPSDNREHFHDHPPPSIFLEDNYRIFSEKVNGATRAHARCCEQQITLRL